MEKSVKLQGYIQAGLPAGRLYYLDWLRIIAILAVFLFHCAKLFDYHTTDVFNPVPSPWLSAFRDFNFTWIMPLFFAISGGAIFFALKPDRVWPFVKSRVTRLLVPLLTVGTFVINPLYVYAVRLFHDKAGGGFFAWYPEYFNGFYGFGGNFAPLGHGTHLWYLEFLFLYTLLLLPWFVRSKRRMAQGLPTWSQAFEKPWALLLLFLPVSLSGGLFELAGLGFVRGMGGWDPVSYLLFLAYGYLIFSNPRIQQVMARLGPTLLAAAVVLTALHVDAHFGFNLVIPGVTRHDMAAGGAQRPMNHLGWSLVQAFRGVLVWCWLLGLLGTASRVLNRNRPGLARANEAVLPFYIMHHAVILLVACWVLGWSAGIAAKYLAIVAISFAIIVAVYALVVRRLKALRFLFGMKTS